MAQAKESGVVYQLKITLQDIKPPVWRRMQVKDCSLGKLHDIIQTCMGWTNSHLHAFEVGREQYSEPYPDGTMETEDERTIKLSQIVARKHKKFSYTYDFGDNWHHTIQIEKFLDAEAGVRYPRCIAGKRACPPDDCGGPWGYGSFLEAVQKPNHPEHKDMLEWIGGEFDPEKFDIEAVNEALGRVR
jgi:Plasmid pRiA4b ORF-3-like protein